jgi:AraC-like DNA-binding protein
MLNKRIIPDNKLRDFVDCYWISKSFSVDTPAQILPGTGSELFFLLSGSIIQNGKSLDESLLTTFRTLRLDLTFSKDTVILAVRFKFSALRHFCDIAIPDMFDQLMSPQQVWGKDFLLLERNLVTYRNICQKIIVIEEFLLKMLNRHCKSVYIDPAEIKKMYYNPQNRRIKEIAEDNCLSIRQFEKRFLAEMGITAKKFQAMSRFQRVVQYCMIHRTSNYLPQALDYGYYDQAHFAKEFKDKAQMSPASFFNENNFSTHFYNSHALTEHTFALKLNESFT